MPVIMAVHAEAESLLRPGRVAEVRRFWLIALALFCCYAYFFYRGGNWNVEARNAQIMALVEDHTLAIDRYAQWTGDKAYYWGHYYSDKLIGPSLVAAPVYWVSRRALDVLGFAPPLGGGASSMGRDERQAIARAQFALRITNVFTNAVPSALLGGLFSLFLAELGIGPALRIWLSFAYGFGTLALPYSTALFGHQLGAVCSFTCFMLLRRQRSKWTAERAAAAGGLAGLGAISDFTTMLAACLLAAYALLVSRGGREARPRGSGLAWRFALFLLIAAVPVALQLSANWSSFGSPFTFPHVHHVQPSFRARHTAGLLGVHLPQLHPLYQLTVGPWRGLFFSSPFLLLALPGFFLLGRQWRAEAVTAAAAWLGVLLMSAGYENWTAGSSYGPRYQIAVIPFLAFAAAPAAQRWPFLFKTLAAISVAFMLMVTAQSPFVSEGLQNPLSVAMAEFSVGRLAHGNLGLVIGLPGLLSLGPLAAVEAAFLYALSGVSRGEE